MNSTRQSFSSLLLGFLTAALVTTACKSTTTSTSVVKQDDVVASASSDDIGSRYDVVMNFSGKGTAVVWDLGVVQGLLGEAEAASRAARDFHGQLQLARCGVLLLLRPVRDDGQGGDRPLLAARPQPDPREGALQGVPSHRRHPQ